MIIIGCDFHTRYQQIAMAREETSELLVERRLDHESGEAHAFYRNLQSSQEPVRVGIEGGWLALSRSARRGVPHPSVLRVRVLTFLFVRLPFHPPLFFSSTGSMRIKPSSLFA